MLQIERFPYSDILGWSNSRYDIFSACRRRYFYHYYNKYDAETDRQHLLHLHDLTSIPLEIGSITHECIASILKRLQKEAASPIDKEKLSNYVTELATKRVDRLHFSEVYYKEIEAIDPSAIAHSAITALGNLLQSDRFNWIVSISSNTSRDWLIEPDKYGETRVNGLKAYCRVDFLFPVSEDLHIIDWKTGKENTEKHSSQIRGYAAWASYQFKKPVALIRPSVAYLLPEYHEIHSNISDMDMADFAKLVQEQTNEMYALCLNIEKNVPKKKDAFSMTRIDKLCGYCNFRELCGKHS